MTEEEHLQGLKKGANAIKTVNYLAYRFKQTTHEKRKDPTREHTLREFSFRTQKRQPN